MLENINKSIERKILLNPGPATTTASVKQALVVSDICPREQEFGELVKNVRQKLVSVVHGSKDYEAVMLGCSGTGAVESVLSSAVDHDQCVLILINGAYGKRMQEICERLGVNHKTLVFSSDQVVDAKEVEKYLAQNRGSIHALAYIHHETTVGSINDIERLQSVASQYQLVSIVDAMSSYAGIPIDVSKNSVDYLISSSNKCIQGMPGLGFVIAKRSALDKIKNYQKRSYYLDLYNNYCNQKEKSEFLFTPPVHILYALDAALNEYYGETGSARYERYSTLYHALCRGMEQLGFKYLVAKENHSKILTTFLSPTHHAYNFNEMHDFFFQREVTIYPGKLFDLDCFRLANLGDLQVSDINYFIELMHEYLKRVEIDILYP